MSCEIDFAPYVDLMFWTDAHSERELLDVVALVRRSSESTEKVRYDSGPRPGMQGPPDWQSIAASHGRLSEVLRESAAVRSFLESSIHSSFTPVSGHKCFKGEFAPGIDSWSGLSVIDGRHLDFVILAKLSNASRQVVREPVWRRPPPSGLLTVSGTSFGPHDVIYDHDRKELWIDGVPKASLKEAKVLLFSEAGGSLELAGDIAIDRELQSTSPQWRHVVLNSPVFAEFSQRES